MKNTEWTQHEDDIIRRYYPREGAACAERLPGRSRGAIACRAVRLGVNVLPQHRKRRGGRAKSWVPSPAEIRERARLVREGRL